MGERIDKELVERGLVSTRSQAQSLINQSMVKCNGKLVTKPSLKVSSTDLIELEADKLYVSRGAFKLKKAIEEFMKTHIKFHLTINSLENSLRTLDPKNVLSRGYSIISKKNNNKVITKTNQLKVGDLLSITIKNGEIEARTTNLKNKILNYIPGWRGLGR